MSSDSGVTHYLLHVFHQFGIDLFFRPNADVMRNVDQQFNQVVRDFPLSLPTERSQKRIADCQQIFSTRAPTRVLKR